MIFDGWVELRKIGASEAMDQLPVWILGDMPVLGMTQTSHFRCNLRRIQSPFPAALVCAGFCMLFASIVPDMVPEHLNPSNQKNTVHFWLGRSYQMPAVMNIPRLRELPQAR